MNLEYKYTKHQTARGTRPDFEKYDTFYLVKNVSELRATYQIRLLAYRGSIERKKLVILLPKAAKLHLSLRALRREYGSLIKIERT